MLQKPPLLSMIRILHIALVLKLGGWHVVLQNRGLWLLVADREGVILNFLNLRGASIFKKVCTYRWQGIFLSLSGGVRSSWWEPIATIISQLCLKERNTKLKFTVKPALSDTRKLRRKKFRKRQVVVQRKQITVGFDSLDFDGQMVLQLRSIKLTNN